MPPAGHRALAGTVTAATCNQCHPDSVNPDGTIDLATGAHLNGQADVTFNCTACHGTAGRTGNLAGTDPLLAASPPAAPAGAPASAVGAHQAHVNPPSAGAFRGPLLCNDCHLVPADAGHATSPPPSPVTFGTLARTGGLSPTFSPTTLGCAATYCHGSFDHNGVRGASGAPLWTDGGIACTDCHGLPPAGHPALPAPVTAATCNRCHPGTVNPDGTINLATGLHVNGLPNVAANCTSCHGDPARPATAANPLLPAAPPAVPTGFPSSVAGAHLLHLTDGAIRTGVDCASCHVVPDDPDHSIQFPPRVVFAAGTLGTTQGAAPTYDPVSMTCSTTYCHGSFAFGGVSGNAGPTPAWSATPTLACTGCHGMPPAGHPALAGPVTAATCSACHPATVRADGTIDVAGGKHMDGLAEVTGGHSDPQWADPAHHGYSASAQGLQTCTSCHAAFGTASGASGSSCNDCHASAGHASWQTECTFCHGTPGRTGNVAGTDAALAAAPPVGPGGQTAATDALVGAHPRHVNPPATGRMAGPFACAVCHATPLPADVAHADGQPVPVPFGGVALTGNVTPSFSPTTLSCSATYCHGNFTGGATAAAPTWTGGAMTCTSCHGSPPGTGQHSRSEHRSAGCGACHSGYSATAANAALHVNGAKNVGGAGTSINTWNATTRTCAPACHGSETW
jgi:predicted CxxxxCH...CXXCH cytochrome family protein